VAERRRTIPERELHIMSEQSTDATAEQPKQEAPGTGAEGAEQPKPDAAPKPTETVEHWKAMAREQERRAKANAEAAKRLQEIEDRDLSELQKAQRAAEQATSRLAEIEQTTIRQRVALEKGVPAALVGRLMGATEDELAADADALLALIKAPTSPRPDPGQGARPTSPTAEADAEYERFFPSSKRA